MVCCFVYIPSCKLHIHLLQTLFFIVFLNQEPFQQTTGATVLNRDQELVVAKLPIIPVQVAGDTGVVEAGDQPDSGLRIHTILYTTLPNMEVAAAMVCTE